MFPFMLLFHRYGGGIDHGPPLPRYIVESMGRVELELYPLSLFVRLSNISGEMTKEYAPFEMYLKTPFGIDSYITLYPLRRESYSRGVK